MPPVDPSRPPALRPDDYPPTLLLRIYGPSSGSLISRNEELRILHVLSTTYGLGPKVFGTFHNGRVEQFFPSRALTSQEIRDPLISKGIARRMRELHSVDLKTLGYPEGDDAEPTVWACLREWTPLAEQVLGALARMGGKWEVWAENFGLQRLVGEVEKYQAWISSHSGQAVRVVFAREF
jgi:choline kinase